MDMPSTEPLAPPSESPQVKEVCLEMVNELGRHINAMAITLLVVCVYVGIAVASTTHQSILLDTPVEIPLFDINAIPLKRFYTFAPTLLVVLHAHLLLLEVLLVVKIEHLPQNLTGDGDAIRFFPSLPVNFLLTWRSDFILRTILLIFFSLVNFVLPLGLLLWAQVQFLVAREVGITVLHVGLFVLDAMLALWFLLRIHNGRLQAAAASSIARFDQNAVRCLRVLITAGIVLSLWIAILTLVEYFLGRPLPMYSWPTRNPTYAGLDMREKDFRGMDLSYADFRDAVLVGSDFRGAILRGANFTDADLRRAKFGPTGGFGDRLLSVSEEKKMDMILQARRGGKRLRPAVLDGAVLEGAILRNAHLEMASLRKASLGGADLANAYLELADFSNATLRNTDLTGAHASRTDFTSAELEGAEFVFANLYMAKLNFATAQNANFTGSELRLAVFNGADFRKVTARGTDFSNGVGDGARFIEARLEGANFRGARIFGAIFRNATVQGATGLWPEAISLRGAAVGGLYLCGEYSTPPPSLADLRDIRPGVKPRHEWELILKDIAKHSAGSWRDKAMDRIALARDRSEKIKVCWGGKKAEDSHASLSVTTTGQSPPEKWIDIVRGRNNLYYDRQRENALVDWPPSREQSVEGSPWDEKTYYIKLASFLIKQARASAKEGDSGFLESLRKTAAGEYSPPDLTFESILKEQLEAPALE
jgi:uncharacterized protein YjbI with pentapeptide repeats